MKSKRLKSLLMVTYDFIALACVWALKGDALFSSEDPVDTTLPATKIDHHATHFISEDAA